jgi:tRNA (cmo5U34)-methyltransferase
MDTQATAGGFHIPTNWSFAGEDVAAGFERHVREQLPWYDLATGAVAHVARHYLPNNGVAYDLGCSTGNISRALADTIAIRHVRLNSIEMSSEMAARYLGPQPENLVVGDICTTDYEPFDLAVSFLTLMFVPVSERPTLLYRLRSKLLPGGAIIIFDKNEAVGGYAGTVLWRLALAGKVAAGVSADDIVAKELSLSGVQRPLSSSLLDGAIEFFRFGEFAGYLIEG